MTKHLKNNIANYLLLSAMFFVSVPNLKAQDNDDQKKLEFGLRLMPTISDFEMKTSSGGGVSGDANLGFGAGLFLGFNFSNNVGLQGEIIYSSISQESNDNNIVRKINLRYVNVPVLLSLNTNKSKFVNLNLVIGPQFGFNVGSSISQSGIIDLDNPQPLLVVKRNDVGLAYGAGLDFGLNQERTFRLSLGYRGVLGLIDVSDKSNNSSTNSYYVIDKAKIKTHSAYLGLSIMFL